MPAAVIYARLSETFEGATSTARQVRECEAYAAAHGLTVVEVFVDEGRSGYARNARRPAFDRAVAAVTEERRADTILVFKLDRLSRRGIGQVGLVLDRLEDVGGRIVSVKDGADSATGTGRMVYALLSEIARQESANTGVRVASAKAEMKARGVWPGGLPPFGYRLVVEARPPRMKRDRYVVDPGGPLGRLVVDATEAAALREAAILVTEGGSIRDAVRALNASGLTPAHGSASWAKSSVARLLRSPILCGWLPSSAPGERDRGTPVRIDGQEVVVVSGPPILTVAERRRLLAAIDSRTRPDGARRRSGLNTGTGLLTGLLICSECQGRMTLDRASSMYRCNRRGIGCRGAGVGIEYAEGEVALRTLRRLSALASEDPSDPRVAAVADRWLARTSPEQDAERSGLAAALADVRARRDDLADARFVHGTVTSETHGRLAPILAEQAADLETRLASLPPLSANLGALLDLVASGDTPEAGPLAEGAAWTVLDGPSRRGILSAVVDVVTVLARDAEDRLVVSWAGDS